LAATIVSELGTLRRFATARQLMGYAGLVPREHSSGSSIHRGAITKTGNAHLRRVMVEAAWAYRHRPNPASGLLRARQHGQPAPIIAIATKAQQRLCPRYRRFLEQGKPPLAVATMIARELLGFMWAIGHAVEPPPVPVGAPMAS
jgi:transposase